MLPARKGIFTKGNTRVQGIHNRILWVITVVIFVISGCANSAKVINNTASVRVLTVQGTVKAADDGDAVKQAKVWVEGTTISTKTNENGRFELKVPRGYYKVLASRNGFYDMNKPLTLDSKVNSVSDFNFNLKTKLNVGGYVDRNQRTIDDAIPEFDTEDKRRIWVLEEKVDSLMQVIKRLELGVGTSDEKEVDRNENSNLDKFIAQYINDDLSCEVVNPNDIRFYNGDEEGVIRLDRPVKVVVNNYDLGYEITVDLKEYISKQYSGILGLTVDADYYFEEMTPANIAEQKKWDENRERMFKGSLRHFLIAMASDKSPLYFGYRLYNGQFVSSTSAMAYSESSVSDIEIEKYDLIFPNILTGNSVMKFDGELRVEYIEKGVEDPDGIMGLDMYKYQTAWLSLNTPSVEFTQNGLFKDPGKVEEKGVWRYQPVCKMLPSDYLPKVGKNS